MKHDLEIMSYSEEKKDWESQVRGSIRTASLNPNNPKAIVKTEDSLIGFIRALLQEAKEEGLREGRSDEMSLEYFKDAIAFELNWRIPQAVKAERLAVVAKVEEWVGKEKKKYEELGEPIDQHILYDLLAFIASIKINSK